MKKLIEDCDTAGFYDEKRGYCIEREVNEKLIHSHIPRIQRKSFIDGYDKGLGAAMSYLERGEPSLVSFKNDITAFEQSQKEAST